MAFLGHRMFVLLRAFPVCATDAGHRTVPGNRTIPFLAFSSQWQWIGGSERVAVQWILDKTA